MSPSSSAAAMPSHVRNRGSSNATPVPDASIKPSRKSSRPGSPAGPFQDPSVPAPNYTVFIRLPFNRGEFRDPAPTYWTAAKDRQLWKLISKSHSGDLDWEGLSQDFDVELNFLLMQAAWLSERHMERMRRQMTRVGGGTAGEGGAGSGIASSSGGGVKMERTASRESKLQSGSTTTAARRGSPSFPISSEVPASPITDEPRSGLPPISRTPSSATVTQSKVTGSRQQQPRSRALRGSSGSTRKVPVAAVAADIVASSKHEHYEDALEHEGRSDSDSGDEPLSALARSQAFRRPPPGKKAKSTLSDLASEGDDDRDDDDDDDDDDASSNGGYLPFAAASKPDPAATLRIGSPKRKPAQPAAISTTNTTATSSNPRSRPPREPPARSNTNPESSQSSTHSSSIAPGPAPSKMTRQPSQLSSAPSSSDNPSQENPRRASYDSASPALRPAHPLSPRQRAQLASLSPRSRKDGSEGSPSMGSSFSDLDDTSVTQSALEEALLSNMRAQGGSTMASRMSSLRDALGRRGG
ncbi:hypothetical protein CBER1_03679 [Cercospora berteroae]|uniref:Autophagy-related protein 29 n=1 Tax=Cercospora berteroae TaxID=357750 RepID=A0A2S6CLJ2_9PEZI|nr:hypothetical protein CBER1_03679 [Cercospora berteroae]